MTPPEKRLLFIYLIELVIYSLFVAVYLMLVYHFLNDWLKALSLHQPNVYALVAILLIVLQSIGLQQFTAFLVNLAHRRKH